MKNDPIKNITRKMYGVWLVTICGFLSGSIARANEPVGMQVKQGVTASISSASALKVQNDRLAILMQERNETAAKLAKCNANGDQATTARIVADLQALDREIAIVQREPVYEIRNSRAVNSLSKSVPVAQPTIPDAQPSGSEKITLEGWDVFKNFGRKGTQR